MNDLDTSLLRKAGLAENQAKVYLALLAKGDLTPAQLAKETGETRPNIYVIADKLTTLGLIARRENYKKAIYKANHPSSLETLAEKRRKITMRNEQEVKQGLSPLIDMFYTLREEPGARTVQGQEGIQEVFNDILRTREDIYYLRAFSKHQITPSLFWNEYKQKRQEIGIRTYAIAPVDENASVYITGGLDKKQNIHRTFYPDNIYDQPVEIEAYGNKVVFIAYGETQMTTIITSPPVAEAMREVFKMLQLGFKDYSNKVKRDLVKGAK